jgi:hypothetical protein
MKINTLYITNIISQNTGGGEGVCNDEGYICYFLTEVIKFYWLMLLLYPGELYRLSNQKQWKSTKKMHFKKNNSSHSCRTFSTVEPICRSWHVEHFCSLNLTSISYSFWNKGRKVLKFWKFDVPLPILELLPFFQQFFLILFVLYFKNYKR